MLSPEVGLPSANWGTIRIMTLLFFIMTLLYHLFFCKCPDYYFHYLIISKRTIISLITLLLFHLFYQHKLFLLLQLSHYYLHYFYIKLLLPLSFSKTIITLISVRIYYFYYCYYLTIICIILYQTIISIIFFETYYSNN